jgi:hypothetical protein
MKKLVFIACLIVTPVFAQDAKEPTVTLTARELQAIVAAEIARSQAAHVYQKVQEAFAPKPSENTDPAASK